MKEKILLTGLMVVLTAQMSLGQFTITDTGFTEHLYNISCPSANTCYVAGGGQSKSVIHKTTDGGNSWETYVNTDTNWLYDNSSCG